MDCLNARPREVRSRVGWGRHLAKDLTPYRVAAGASLASRRFAAVTGHAESLQVAAIPEQGSIAPMWHLVIDGGAGGPLTVHANRLFCKDAQTQSAPGFGAVPFAGVGVVALPFLLLGVDTTIATRHQQSARRRETEPHSCRRLFPTVGRIRSLRPLHRNIRARHGDDREIAVAP